MRDTDNISEYWDKLDQTLSSHDLVNDDLLKNLVKNQMLRSSECGLQECSDNLVERRTKEMENFLSMLRSTSVTDSKKAKSSEAARGVWKIKQDTEDYRVMNREGPEGTPFHTFLVEGYVDGPSDVCLCISWGAKFYNKWWPQTIIPTFKVAASECVQKIREGEQICIVRRTSFSLCMREANHIKKIAPASPVDAPHVIARTSVDQSKEDNVASVHADIVPVRRMVKEKES